MKALDLAFTSLRSLWKSKDDISWWTQSPNNSLHFHCTYKTVMLNHKTDNSVRKIFNLVRFLSDLKSIIKV